MSNTSCSITNYDIAIIGGGASGLMLAANLDLAGKSGIILEGSSKLGSKLLMSGGGRCNITHAGSIKDFINAYGDAGPCLRKVLYRHSNLELCEWFKSHGVALTEEDARIFPASMKARDILTALTDEAAHNSWQIETDAKVASLKSNNKSIPRNNLSVLEETGYENHDLQETDFESACTCEAEFTDLSAWKIELENHKIIAANRIVIATGGITYPETGSDGSMFDILQNLGVSINPPHSALAPIYVKEYPYSELSGISVQDVTVTAFSSDASCTCKGKSARMTGDLLFTHEGFSGPVILNISKYASPGELIRLSYNKDFSELPKRMQRVLESRCKGPSGDIRTNALASLLDHDDFTVSGIDSRGMVTSGGVSLSDVDLSTMHIKRLANEKAHAQCTGSVYVIGEAIDADGITGGYNLQLCWSTAKTAADSLLSILMNQ